MSNAFDDRLLNRTFAQDEGIPTLPRDAYQTIADSIGYEANYTAWVNHFDLSREVDYALGDLDGLVEASMLAGQWDTTPRLAASLKRMLVNGFAIPEFESHFRVREAEYIEKVSKKLSLRTLQQTLDSPDYMLADESEKSLLRRKATVGITEMQISNISQHAIGIQNAAWRQGQKAYIEFVKRFTDTLRLHDWACSLRMPVTMIPSVRHDLLRSSSTAGIGMIEAYQSATQNELLTQVFDQGLSECLFRPLHLWQHTPALTNRAQFIWWDSIASFATARHADSGLMISLIPSQLPPWLLMGHEYTATVYMHEWTLGTHTEQAVMHYDVPPAQLSSIPQIKHDRLERYIAHGLSLMAIGLTLWANQIRLGSGHKIPAWTATPMNPTTVRWFLELLTRIENV